MRYVDIKLSMNDHTLRRAVFGRIVFMLHRLIVTDQLPIAVAWPQAMLGDLGHCLRIFNRGNDDVTENAVLDQLKQFPPELMTHERCFRDAPDSRLTVRYTRNRRLEKQRDKLRESRNRYREQRGLPINPHTREITETDVAQSQSRIHMQSTSNGQQYALFIQHEFMPDGTQAGNGASFGLGHVLPHF